MVVVSNISPATDLPDNILNLNVETAGDDVMSKVTTELGVVDELTAINVVSLIAPNPGPILCGNVIVLFNIALNGDKVIFHSVNEPPPNHNLFVV